MSTKRESKVSEGYVIEETQAKRFIILNSMILICMIGFILLSQLFWLLLPATVFTPIVLLMGMYIYRLTRRQLRIWLLGPVAAEEAEERDRAKSVSIISRSVGGGPRSPSSASRQSFAGQLQPQYQVAGGGPGAGAVFGGTGGVGAPRQPDCFVTESSAGGNRIMPDVTQRTCLDDTLPSDGRQRQSVASSVMSDDPFLSVSASNKKHALQRVQLNTSQEYETISDVRLHSAASSGPPNTSDLALSTSSSEERTRNNTNWTVSLDPHVHRAISHVIDERVQSTSSDDTYVRKTHHTRQAAPASSSSADHVTSTSDDPMQHSWVPPPLHPHPASTLVPLDTPQLTADQKLRWTNRLDSDENNANVGTPPVDIASRPFYLPKLAAATPLVTSQDPRLRLYYRLHQSGDPAGSPPVGVTNNLTVGDHHESPSSRSTSSSSGSRTATGGRFPPVIQVQSLDQKQDELQQQQQRAQTPRSSSMPSEQRRQELVIRMASLQDTQPLATRNDSQSYSLDIGADSGGVAGGKKADSRMPRMPSLQDRSSTPMPLIYRQAANPARQEPAPLPARPTRPNSIDLGANDHHRPSVTSMAYGDVPAPFPPEIRLDQRYDGGGGGTLSATSSVDGQPPQYEVVQLRSASVNSDTSNKAQPMHDPQRAEPPPPPDRKVSELQYRRSVRKGGPLLPPIQIDPVG